MTTQHHAEVEALFDLDALKAPIAEVTVDARCGHIGLNAEPDHHGAFVNLGSELHWWSYSALHLDPAGARQLADALNAWADRHDFHATTTQEDA